MCKPKQERVNVPVPASHSHLEKTRMNRIIQTLCTIEYPLIQFSQFLSNICCHVSNIGIVSSQGEQVCTTLIRCSAILRMSGYIKSPTIQQLLPLLFWIHTLKMKQ